MEFKKITLLLILVTFLSAIVNGLPSFDGNMTVNCQKQPNFNIREKEYCLGEIPINYSGEIFKCISYVRTGNNTLQTNPEYKERSDSLFNLWGEQDLREHFTPANMIVNFYYTKKNLNTETKYIVGVICNSNQTTLNGETTMSLNYENLDFIFARTEWAMRNVNYIIAFVLVLLILIITGGLIWKSAT